MSKDNSPGTLYRVAEKGERDLTYALLSASSVFSCWLSIDKGIIWSFVGPMLAVILVSLKTDFIYDEINGTLIGIAMGM